MPLLDRLEPEEKVNNKKNLLVLLDEWSIIFRTRDDQNRKDEEKGIFLQGKTYGHPILEDGSFVKTSRILAYESGLFETENRMYALGEISAVYADKCCEDVATIKKRLIDEVSRLPRIKKEEVKKEE